MTNSKFSFFKEGVTSEQKTAFAKALAKRVAVSIAVVGGIIGADQIISKVKYNQKKDSTVIVLYDPLVPELDEAVGRKYCQHEYLLKFPESVAKIVLDKEINEIDMHDAIVKALIVHYRNIFLKSPNTIQVIHFGSWIVIVQ